MATPSAPTIRFRNCERSRAPRFRSTFQGIVPVSTPCGSFTGYLCAEFPAQGPRKIDEGQDWHGCRTDLVNTRRGLERAVFRQFQEVFTVNLNLIPTAARMVGSLTPLTVGAGEEMDTRHRL